MENHRAVDISLRIRNNGSRSRVWEGNPNLIIWEPNLDLQIKRTTNPSDRKLRKSNRASNLVPGLLMYHSAAQWQNSVFKTYENKMRDSTRKNIKFSWPAHQPDCVHPRHLLISIPILRHATWRFAHPPTEKNWRKRKIRPTRHFSAATMPLPLFSIKTDPKT